MAAFPGQVAATPVLWICGPAGSGKTTVAWELYAELARSGAEVGYVDIDQLGMCFPEPQTDPGRYRIAARNLAAVVAGHRASGARAVVVSGVVDPTHGVRVDRIPGIVLTTCRLRADADELRRRLTERRADSAFIGRALADAETLDADGGGGLCIDTTCLTVDQVVARVRARTAGWRDRTSPAVPGGAAEPRPPADGPVLWLCGPTGVGKSTAGFTVFMRHVLGAKIAGAYIDLDQIGCYRPASPAAALDHVMRARIVADMWQVFRGAGAGCLVLVGPVGDATEITTYARALPAATFTVCRLHASPEELARRIVLRGRGGSWAQPGDPLKGRSATYLSAVAGRAAAAAAALEQLGVGDVRIDTGGLTAERVADAIIAETRWPAG